MALHLYVVFYIKLKSVTLKIPQVVEFPDFLLSRMNVRFIPYIRTVRKKSEWLITLALKNVSYKSIDHPISVLDIQAVNLIVY
jgi:hypothetical protein